MVMWGQRRGITSPEELQSAWEEHQLSRRGLGKAAAAVVAGYATSGCAGGEGDTESDTDTGGGGDGARVVIVGGGVAGIHCAYRLKEAGIKATVHDAWNRVGGRMYSTSEGAPAGMVIELGGELIDSNHATLWALSEELGITLDDRHAVATGEVYWVDGAAADEATVLTQWMAVAPTMAMMVEAADNDDAAYEMYDNLSLRDWLDANVPIATYRELHIVLDTAYRGEFGLENDEQSSLNMLYLIGSDTVDEFKIFGESDERWHTHGGNETFITKMAEALDADQVVLESRLIAARDGDGGAFVLTFAAADGAESEVECDHVVFALPYNKLRECDLTALTLSDEKRQIIDELGYGTNAKVMGNFTSPIWRDMYTASGSVTGDIAFQQCWDTSIGQAGPEGIMTNFLGGQAGVDSGTGSAEEWYTTKLVAGLEEVFPGAQAAYIANSAVRMHWPSVPTHMGSYTCYKPGQWAFWSLEGVREGNLHFCGEHCSPEFQGWMEGGAETGGLVAMEIIDDLGATASPFHLDLVARQTSAAPHPCYHGDRNPPLRWGARRRLLRERFGARLGAR
ncbi:MAG: FAD-dependent oxidoreductase [Myxococcales bacterium]|nr:FAD-dependent oxidoreductase [Myxococcales bacterium]